MQNHLVFFNGEGQAASRALLVSIRNTAAIQVVHRQFDGDFIAGKNLDVVHTHLPGDMRQNLMAVLKLDPKHGVG